MILQWVTTLLGKPHLIVASQWVTLLRTSIVMSQWVMIYHSITMDNDVAMNLVCYMYYYAKL